MRGCGTMRTYAERLAQTPKDTAAYDSLMYDLDREYYGDIRRAEREEPANVCRAFRAYLKEQAERLEHYRTSVTRNYCGIPCKHGHTPNDRKCNQECFL